jgi:hypothetical protein
MLRKIAFVDLLSFLLILGLGADLIYVQKRMSHLELAASGNDALDSAKLLPMPVTDRHGERASIEAGKPRLIFYMSPNCGSCGKNMPAWSEAAQRVGQTNVLFLIPDTSGLASIDTYLGKYNIAGYPAALADPEVLQRNSMTALPRTLLVDGNGRVEKVWRGAVTASAVLQAWSLLKR